jgi:hypothetical protein
MLKDSARSPKTACACTCLHLDRPATQREERDYRHGPAAFVALVEVAEGTVVLAAHGRGLRGEVLELADITELPAPISDIVRN